MDQLAADVWRQGHVLCIGGLPEDTTVGDIKEEFGQFGSINGVDFNDFGVVRIVYDSVSQAKAGERYLRGPDGPGNMAGSTMGNVAHPMMSVTNPLMSPLMNPLVAGLMNPMVNPMLMNQMAMMNNPQSVPFGPTRSAPSQTSPVGSQVTGAGVRRLFTSPQGPPSSQSTEIDKEKGHTLEVGSCTLCLKRTSYTCGRCGAFYCSRECQSQNWPDHKARCNNNMPPLNFAGKKLITEVELVQEDRGRASSTRLPDEKGSQLTRPGASEIRGQHGSLGNQHDRRDQRDFRSQRDQGRDNWGRPDQNQNHDRRFNNDNVHEHADQRDGVGNSHDDRHNRMQGGGAQRFNGQRSSMNGSRNYQNGGDNVGGRRDGDKPRERQFGSSRGTSNMTNGERRSEYNNQNSRIGADGPARSPSVVPQTAEASVESPSGSQNESAPAVNQVSVPVPVESLSKSLSALKLPPQSPSQSVATSSSSPEVSASEARTSRPPVVDILSGEKVVVSFVTPESNSIFIQPLSRIEDVALMSSKLKTHCAETPSLSRAPKKKEFLAAKFSLDKTYYRAIVEARTDKVEQTYKVRFVDFGNDEDGVKWDSMVCLPESVAMIPCMAVETSLKGVPKELFAEQFEVLSSYMKKETELTVEFSDDVKQGVVLKDKDGNSINEKILATKQRSTVVGCQPSVSALAGVPESKEVPCASAPVAAPTPVAAPAPVSATKTLSHLLRASLPVPVAQKKFVYDDVVPFPFPPPGTKLQVLINHIHDVGFIMACPVSDTAILETTQCSEAIQSYVPSAAPYRPEENELCIAKWTDGLWYRAVCLGLQPDDAFSVLFLEYGNSDTVRYPEIVAMTEELAKFKALSSACELSGPKLTPIQVAKLKEMKKEDWVEECTVIRRDSEGSETVILDIPAIRNIL